MLCITHCKTGMQLKSFRAQIENVTSRQFEKNGFKMFSSRKFYQSQELPMPHVMLRDNYRPGPLRCSLAAVAARAIGEVSSSLHSLEQCEELQSDDPHFCSLMSCILLVYPSWWDLSYCTIVEGYWILLIYFAKMITPSSFCGTPARPRSCQVQVSGAPNSANIWRTSL